MAAIKYTNILIKAKKKNYFSLMREKGPKYFLQKYDELDSVQDKQMFLKRVIVWYGMICYAMLSYAMVLYGKYGVL